MKTFSIKEALGKGWEIFRTRPFTFIAAVFILFIVSGILNIFQNSLQNQGFASFLFFFVSVAVGTLLDMGITAFALKSHLRPESVQLSDLWHPHPFWNYLGATILVAICTVIGLILLIIPGIIVALMLMFVKFIIIDKGMGPIAAMQESARITKGHRWKLLGFAICLALVNVLGFIVFFVGLLVAIPVTTFAVVHVYRTLSAGNRRMVE